MTVSWIDEYERIYAEAGLKVPPPVLDLDLTGPQTYELPGPEAMAALEKRVNHTQPMWRKDDFNYGPYF